MSLKEPVRENMSEDFDTFRIGSEEAEPDEGQVRGQLQTVGHRYGVIVRDGADGSLMAVRMFDAATGRFSDLKTGPDTRMSDIINTEEMLSKINDTEAPGIIIVEGGEAVGVLSEKRLREYFDQQDFTVHTRVLGDLSLHGNPTVEAYSVICASPGCGALNIVTEFDEGKTMCVNGHVLIAP